ncbi:MAG: hypothetical protein ACI4TW_05415 [Prevotella sp.]
MMLLVSFFTTATLISCGGDDDDPEDVPSGNGGTNSSAMDANTQKLKLEACARELMGKVNASEFSNIANIINSVRRNTDTGTETEAVQEWFEACSDACIISSTSTNTKRLYLASNFEGTFEYQNGKWVQTAQTGALTFRFYDTANKLCVVKATTSGKEYKVHHNCFDSEEYTYYPSYSTKYTENAFMIPENINVTLTQGGTEVASVTAHTTITLANSSTGEVDFSKDKCDVSTTVKINNYTFTVEKANFSGGSNANATVSAWLNKASERLITLYATLNGDTTDEDNLKAGKLTFSVDALGKVKASGEITDMDQFRNAIDDSDRNETNEAAFRSAITTANNLLNVNLYFDGSSSSSSYVKLEPYKEWSYYDSEYWNYDTVIYFSDGTGYNSFEEFFDEVTFDNVINTFENLIEDFDDLID